MISTQDFSEQVFFKNDIKNRYWEISGPEYTTYLMHDMIYEKNMEAIKIMIIIHRINDIDTVCNLIIDYTEKKQDCVFMVDVS